MNARSAIGKINKKGALLVFPIQNRPEPASLWSEFFPRRKMRWEWDESSDDNVSALWHLMKRLSYSRQVVYSKWYQGRATFFSRDLFAALLKLTLFSGPVAPLSDTARALLEILENDSPLSTKELKRAGDLQGRLNESRYRRAMKELFTRFHVIGFGEVDDGAFPSLAVGASRLLYEDIWFAAQKMSQHDAEKRLDRDMPRGSSLRKYFDSKARSR
jgi:hypothetical protein